MSRFSSVIALNVNLGKQACNFTIFSNFDNLAPTRNFRAKNY
ncbi:hypothetical protein [Clostridium oryzae]|uniref:Uncharacterized protein n=1 Tax=Clostridium oryzae TaxID=1450648 RepID=A0A1V4IMN9_9CLOT|nr:hypothetical protein [Clostridium oryzae]OPJ61090.1 hypothetical protein CLORY_24880 [Clostridium oryzae]